MNGYIPSIIENSGRGLANFDLPSRLLKDRIIMVNDTIMPETAYSINMQLMYLDSIDNKDITMYINTPGGSVYAGLSIYDTMSLIKSNVNTIATGIVASMGAFLLSVGTGVRACTPEARIMIHAVSGGVGNAGIHDMRIDFKETEYINTRIHQIMSERSNLSLEQILIETERDKWLSGAEAIEMGIIDKIVTPTK